MRARNIKPGFFINEDLAEVDAHGRLLFIGLWCLADREGKLEDRPKRIKGELFRYDAISYEVVDEQLAKLSELGLITRYEIDGARYIHIPNFLKHQSPHYNEKPSTIPDQLLTKDESAFNQGDNNVATVGGSLPPDSLNPDIRNPDSQKESPNGDISAPPLKKSSRKPKAPETQLPDNFGISEAVHAWAVGQGFTRLEEHLQSFRDYALSRGKTYADWDAAFRRAIRENWAKVGGNGQFNKPNLKPGESHGNNLAAETDKYSTRAGRKIVDLDSP